jgi:hypothetical protein
VEPVSGTRAVRRTVRVAVALIVGQALLCMLIGWLTFGHPRSTGSTVDEMAAPPLSPPPAVTGDYAPTAGSVPAATPARVTTSGRKTAWTRAATDPPTFGPPTIDPATIVPALKSPPAVPLPPPPTPTVADPTPGSAATTSPPVVGLQPPQPVDSPSPVVASPEVQSPVVVGELCRPELAYGRTAGGTVVRCLRTWHHRPRWKIV